MIVWRTRGDYRTARAVLEAIIAFSAMHTLLNSTMPSSASTRNFRLVAIALWSSLPVGCSGEASLRGLVPLKLKQFADILLQISTVETTKS